MKTIYHLLIFCSLGLISCGPCNDNPRFRFILNGLEEGPLEISSTDHDESTIYEIPKNQNYTWSIEAEGSPSLHSVKFNYPIPQQVTITPNNTFPSDVVSLVYNTGDPYMDGRQWTKPGATFENVKIDGSLITTNDRISFNVRVIATGPPYRNDLSCEKDVVINFQVVN